MSFSKQTHSFFDPLVGKTTTFLLEGRQANLVFARTAVALMAQSGYDCAILDLDALYSSNSDKILASLSGEAAKSTTVRVPEPGSDIEEEFSELFNVKPKIIIVDSLNSFYHLLSIEDGSSRSRKLTFAVAGLSYVAKTNAKAIIFTMYVREGLARPGRGRSISGLSDLTASVEVRGPELTVRSERGLAWPGGRLSIRSP
jgi:hypothetical protein